MATDKHLTYRGDLKALAGSGGDLLFVTVHPEGQATEVCRLDVEKTTLKTISCLAAG